MLYVRMLVMLLISLYTSRVILNVLGIEDYGIYNVVAGVITMLGFLSASLGGATARFIAFDLGKGDTDKLKKTFGNILSIYLLLAVIVLIVGETLGLWFMSTQLQIPDDRQTAAMWIYQFSIVSFMLTVISAPYNSLIIAHEKMSAFAYISIVDAVLKLLIVYLLQVIPYDKLIVYAILYFCVQAFSRILYGIYCSRHFRESHTHLQIEKKQFREILSFAGWTMNGNLAIIGYTQGLNALLNIFFGPAINAAYAVAVQVRNVCYQFCSGILMAPRPQIVKSYARGDFSYMHYLVLKASKFAFFILFLIALPLCFEAETVLTWWLGIVPDHTANFLRLVLCTALLRCLASPIIDCVHATGRLKKFQLIEGSMLLSIVPIAYLLLKFTTVPPESVFIVYVVVDMLTLYARVRIVLPMVKMRLRTYFMQVIVPILFVVLVAPILPIIVYSSMQQGILSLFVVCAVCVVSTLLAIYTLGCSSDERILIVNKTKSILARIFHR